MAGESNDHCPTIHLADQSISPFLVACSFGFNRRGQEKNDTVTDAHTPGRHAFQHLDRDAYQRSDRHKQRSCNPHRSIDRDGYSHGRSNLGSYNTAHGHGDRCSNRDRYCSSDCDRDHICDRDRHRSSNRVSNNGCDRNGDNSSDRFEYSRCDRHQHPDSES